MQGTIQNYTLEMTGEKKKEPLRVKQYDTNSRLARITLKAFGEPWLIPIGCRAYINIRKSDNTVVMNDCEIEGENIVLAPITEQATAVPGIQQAELYFLTIDGDIKSQTFPIQVLPAIMDQRVIESSNEFGTLQTAILGAQEATSAAQDAAAEAMVQAGEARDAAEIAMDAAASIDEAVQAATRAKTSETNAKVSETAAAQAKADVEALKEGFIGYDKIESGRKYANALTTTAEGEGQVAVTDAWEAPVVSMEISGRSEQVVTTGAQLFDASRISNKVNSGITLTNNKDGSFTFNGTASGYAPVGEYEAALKANVNYTVGAFIKSGSVSGDELKSFRVRVIPLGSTTEIDYCIGTTFSIKNETDSVKFLLQIETGYSCDNLVIFPMINEGDNALPWEPYTGGIPSPNPEYPQAIKGVEHVVNSGSQLFDASRIPTKTAGGATVTNNGDGSFTISGNSELTERYSQGIELTRAETLSLFKPGVYTLSGIKTNPYCLVKLVDGSKILVELNLSHQNNAQRLFARDMLDNENVVAVLQFYGLSGSTITPGTVKPMLNAGSVALPWEPYNGQQRETDLQVAVTGKNLFNKEAVYSYNVNGVDIVQLDKGMRIYNNTARTYACAAVKVKLKPNTTYTYSCKVADPRTKSAVGIRKSLDNGNTFDPTMISGTGAVTTTQTISRTFTTDEKEYYAVCLFCTYDEEMSGDTTFENIQLEEGGTKTIWEPYHEPQSVSLPLAEPLHGIGDVRDRIAYKDGVWGIERNVGKVDNNQWKMNNVESGTTGHRFFYIAEDIVKQPKPRLCCTKYTQKDNVVSFSDKGDYISSDETHTTKRINIRTLGKDFSTVEDFKAFMSDAETIYPLATPTWEPFPAETQTALNALTTHPGTTYLTVASTDVAAPVRLTYVQDTRKVIDGLRLDLAEQMIELQAQIDQLKVTNNLA